MVHLGADRPSCYICGGAGVWRSRRASDPSVSLVTSRFGFGRAGRGLGWVLWAAASGGLLNEHFVVILTHWVLWLLVLREFYSRVSWWLLLGLLVGFQGSKCSLSASSGKFLLLGSA